MWDKPLDWWARNEHRFPHLALMTRQYLGCPASSASAERMFSLAGRLFSDLRQSMNDGTLEKRMWAKINRVERACFCASKLGNIDKYLERNRGSKEPDMP